MFSELNDNEDMSLLTIPPRDNRKRRYEWLSPYAYVRDPDTRAKIAELENKLAVEMQKRTAIEEELRTKKAGEGGAGTQTSQLQYLGQRARRIVTPDERRLELQLGLQRRLLLGGNGNVNENNIICKDKIDATTNNNGGNTNTTTKKKRQYRRYGSKILSQTQNIN